MERQDRINEVRNGFAEFVAKTKAASALDQTDLFKISEDVVCPILRIVLDLPSLRNLNESERVNYPGVDLGDSVAGVGIQVTAAADAKKLRSTVVAAVRNQVFETYPRLLVYVLGERQRRYTVNLDSEKSGVLVFEPNEDVLDYKDVLARLRHRSIADIAAVADVLREEVTGGVPPRAPTLALTEPLWANLVELSFPDELFVAHLVPEATSKRKKAQRRVAREYLKNEFDLRAPTDWTIHSEQLVTFRDPSDSSEPISRIVDQGTVTSLLPQEYFGIDGDHENVFKDLLRRCLQQKLYPRGVGWQDQEHLFIFLGDDEDDVRTETWFGEKTSTRRVFERERKLNEPDKTWVCKHLGFGARFHLIAGRWYIGLKPEWYFSSDGYRRSWLLPDKVDYLKRKERNQQVFNHLKFIVHFVGNDPPPDLFRTFKTYPFLKIASLCDFTGGVAISDADWRKTEVKEEQELLSDPLGDLPLFEQSDAADASS